MEGEGKGGREKEERERGTEGQREGGRERVREGRRGKEGGREEREGGRRGREEGRERVGGKVCWGWVKGWILHAPLIHIRKLPC